jgi:hypothetical protein
MSHVTFSLFFRKWRFAVILDNQFKEEKMKIHDHTVSARFLIFRRGSFLLRFALRYVFAQKAILLYISSLTVNICISSP